MSPQPNEQTVKAPVPTVEPAPAAGSGAVLSWGANSIFDRPDERYIGRSLITSLALHAGLALLILFIMSIKPAEKVVEAKPDKTDLVFLEQPGPGGGGGGSPAPAPAAKMEIPKPKPTVAPIPTPVPVPEPVPTPTLNAPVMTMSNVLQASGASSISLAAYGGGGSGGGVGSGTGNGVGPGTGGGFGGGAYRPGNGCQNPTVVLKPDPKYTSDAMRAKLQGDVELDAIVTKNGTVGDVQVSKSLDKQFGLDLEAIASGKKWVFRPATCQGQPVDMMVTLIIEFRLH